MAQAIGRFYHALGWAMRWKPDVGEGYPATLAGRARHICSNGVACEARWLSTGPGAVRDVACSMQKSNRKKSHLCRRSGRGRVSYERLA